MSSTENTVNLRKKIIGKAILIFFAVMLLLTFFSNTINNFSLPKVTYETPSRGSIIKEISSEGSVQAQKVLDAYTQTNMQVLSLNVKTGDAVQKGQEIMTLDISSIQSQLEDESARCEQKKLSLKKLQQNSAANLLSCDRTVENSKNALNSAKVNYDNIKALYTAGGDTESNLKNAENNLQIAQMDYTLAKNARDKSINDSENDIKSLRYDIEIEDRKILQLQEQLKLASVTAPADGVIIELNFQEGSMANSSAPLYKLSDTSKGFEFKTSVDYDLSSYLVKGDAASVSIDSFAGRTLEGKVIEITDTPQQRGIKKDVYIEISSEGLSGGESGSVDIKKNTGSYNALVSNSAVGQDNSGYFVYTVTESKGPLGNEYYAKKAYMTIGESDDLKTAVTNGLNGMDKVIDYSDKPLSDGTRIMLTQ
jgi:HlyD family secretion protein